MFTPSPAAAELLALLVTLPAKFTAATIWSVRLNSTPLPPAELLPLKSPSPPVVAK